MVSGLGFAVNRGGTRVYVTRAGFNINLVEVVDPVGAQIVDTIQVGEYPTGISLTPDGSRIYVVNSFGHSVSIIDSQTNAVVATVPVGPGPRADGQFITPGCDSAFDCNDENACTTDTCDAGRVCVYPSVDCDDANPCTDESCDPQTGCVHTPVAGCVPVLSPEARRCQAVLADTAQRWAAGVHARLSRCLQRLLREAGSGGDATEFCRARLDPTDPASVFSRRRSAAVARMARTCGGIEPAEIHTPCDSSLAFMTDVIDCVLAKYLAGAERGAASVYRDACAMLPAVRLGAAFPAVCSDP
jgi:YVTN family beta-propeller protein